jgi:RND family efflux transporter MFP subunit
MPKHTSLPLIAALVWVPASIVESAPVDTHRKPAAQATLAAPAAAVAPPPVAKAQPVNNPAAPAAPAAAKTAVAQALGCLIEPERVVEVGSPVIGVISQMEVERGAIVKKGQVLAHLRADVERASLTAAQLRATAEAEVLAAGTSAAFNKERLARAEELHQQQYISQQALQQARTESRLADQKLTQAIEQRHIVKQEREVVAAQLSQRTIKSPIDGVVAERYLSAGERVDDKPLLRIAKVDPLRVQLVVPIAQYGFLRVGGQASVTPELPGAAARTARVTLVDRVIDPASNTFRVHLELPNAKHELPAGLRCKAEYATGGEAVVAPAAAAPATVRPAGGKPVALAPDLHAPVALAQAAADVYPEPLAIRSQRFVLPQPAAAAVARDPLRGVAQAQMAERYAQALKMSWVASPTMPAPALREAPSRNHRGVALAWLDESALAAARGR